MPTQPSKTLETFDNPQPNRDYLIHIEITNKILDDLVEALQPRYMRLKAKWWVRGGIYTTVVAEHRKPGWAPQPMVELPEFETNDPTRG